MRWSKARILWKTFLWGAWEDWKIPIIVGSSLSTVTAVLHSKGIRAKLFHQDVFFRHLKPTEWNLLSPIFSGWSHLFPSWKMQQSKLCILTSPNPNWKMYKKHMKTRPWHNFSTKNGPKKSEQITCLITTLLTLLRIPFLGRIGSISYVLPIWQNINFLNRDIRVCT